MIRRMGWGKPVDENNHKKQLSTQPIYTVASLSAHSNKLGRVPENYHLACGYNSAVLELENINRSVHKLVTIKFQTLCTNANLVEPLQSRHNQQFAKANM